jgi:hypothetical protein
MVAVTTVGPIERFMVEDHARLDRLLDAALEADGAIDLGLFAQFRRGLLRHIAMEERVLLPYARAKQGGRPLPIACSLRIDHGLISKALAGSPTLTGIRALCEILNQHNPLEEGPGGLYAICDGLAGEEAPAVVAQLRAVSQAQVAAASDAHVS